MNIAKTIFNTFIIIPGLIIITPVLLLVHFMFSLLDWYSPIFSPVSFWVTLKENFSELWGIYTTVFSYRNCKT